MWKRIVFDILALGMVFFTPWWAALLFGILGVVLFSWYVELIFLGMFYDVFFGGVAGPWYYHLLHTGIFTLPLLVIEFIKTKINLH